MQLYYFTSMRYGLEAIRDWRLKIARLNELNDPFEQLWFHENSVGTKRMQDEKNILNNCLGLICLSSKWQHPLMWAHYAKNHSGICLGFNITEDSTSLDPNSYTGLREITYLKNRTSIRGPSKPTFSIFTNTGEFQNNAPPILTINPGKYNELKEKTHILIETFNHLYSAKAKYWKYEHEYRFTCALENKDPISSQFFEDFGTAIELNTVIVGTRCSATRDQVSDVLTKAGHPNTVRLCKAQLSNRHFKVVAAMRWK